MMVVVCKWAGTVAAVLLLAGCMGGGGGGSGGGGGGGGTPADPRLARLDAYEAQRIRVLGDPDQGIAAMPLTAADALPVDGTATFTGSATIRVELQSDPLVLFGDAAIDMDFATGQTSGRLHNFFGGTLQGRVADYQGEITVSGTVAGQNTALDYGGTLTVSDTTLGFAGTLEALFLGTPVAAIAASDLEAVVDHNGTLRNATLVVTGEGTVSSPPAASP